MLHKIAHCGVVRGIIQTAQQTGGANPDWTRPFPPFRIIGNIYWVGSYDLSTYLIVTPQGNILINTGVGDNRERHQGKRRAARVSSCGHEDSLGDARTLRSCRRHGRAQAHDRRDTGDLERDAELLESGGKKDFRFGSTAKRAIRTRESRQVVKDGEHLRSAAPISRASPSRSHTKGAVSLHPERSRRWKDLSCGDREHGGRSIPA
jgi:metallo-beta-lactamase class B